jgi:hypothetical protein
MLLLDGMPETSLLLRNYPELRAYRDIAAWWKYFLNPDVSVFPNYSDPAAPKDVPEMDRLQAQQRWGWSNEENGFQVVVFGNTQLRARPDPKKTDPVTGRIIPPELLPRNRYPSTATPSFYCSAKPLVVTEDDVIYRPNLPTFDAGAGQVLTQRDSELLLSFLTVPYIRLPLVITFFASDDRVHKLLSPKLKGILDAVLFEPGRYLKVSDTGVVPAMVPTQHSGLLASAFGLLMSELHRAPHNVLRSVQVLITGALALDTGSVVDAEDTDFNTGVDIILYVVRLAARVDNYLSFLVDLTEGKHRCLDGPLRDVAVGAECLAELKAGRAALRARLHGEVATLLDEYLTKLDADTAAAPGDEKKIDRNSRLACDLHAHRLALYRNVLQEALTPGAAKVLVGSFVFLTTRHTWNKAARGLGRLLVPET